MKKHLSIKVYGEVQGVLFRVASRKKASEYDIKGWIKNLEDGSVHIEAEGEEQSLEQFLSWCYRGPLFAKVIKIETKSSFDLKNFNSFDIRYD